jgi:hypothetical protein
MEGRMPVCARLVTLIVLHLRPPMLGILPELLSALHSAGIITEDLSLSPGAVDSMEATYRGLGVRPAKTDSSSQPRIRRRIGVGHSSST